MYFLYDVIFSIFALFSIPKFLIRFDQAQDGKQMVQQRYGFFSSELKAKFSGKKILWLHAVSVGEVNAAREWINLFLNQHSDWTIALSTTTPTGQTIANSIASERVIVFYAPFDLSFSVQRVLQSIQPRVIILMETEIWPNLIQKSNAAGIPIGIMNGRISPRSFGRYKWIGAWLPSIFNKLSFCLVQSKRDQDYFEQLGMPLEKIVSTGNMKFDLNGQTNQTVFKIRGLSGTKVLIGGSTHTGEEQTLLSVFKRLRASMQNLKLVLVPRHPERVPQVEQIIKQSNFRFCLYSKLEGSSELYDVLLVDRMGVLSSLYSAGDVVFVGGSFVERGGQNPIEPASLKKPVLHGPNVANFHEVYRILDEQRAAVLVHSEDELYQQSRQLLERPQLQQEMGARAWASIQSMKGASARNLNYLDRWISGTYSTVALA